MGPSQMTKQDAPTSGPRGHLHCRALGSAAQSLEGNFQHNCYVRLASTTFLPPRFAFVSLKCSGHTHESKHEAQSFILPHLPPRLTLRPCFATNNYPRSALPVPEPAYPVCMASKEMENGGLGAESLLQITAITPTGDLVLDIHDEGRSQVFSYRVSAEHLKQASPYFVRLLDPSKFGEGAQVAEKLKELRKTYPDIEDAPSKELPRVSIADIGRISKVNTIKNLVTDFLNIVHRLEISTVVPPIPNLANLAVVADRFDALPHFSAYARRKKVYSTIDTRSKGKVGLLSEERLRQKLLIGLLLDHPPWIATYSKRLIIGGSSQWKPDAEENDELASWWDMPHGLEGITSHLIAKIEGAIGQRRENHTLYTLEHFIPYHSLKIY
jgi:hypothetical protein